MCVGIELLMISFVRNHFSVEFPLLACEIWKLTTLSYAPFNLHRPSQRRMTSLEAYQSELFDLINIILELTVVVLARE